MMLCCLLIFSHDQQLAGLAPLEPVLVMQPNEQLCKIKSLVCIDVAFSG